MSKTGTLQIKTYFAKSVDQAITQARTELGEEALLLNTRRLSEGGKPSGYEVVMGVPAVPLVLPRIASSDIAADASRFILSNTAPVPVSSAIPQSPAPFAPPIFKEIIAQVAAQAVAPTPDVATPAVAVPDVAAPDVPAANGLGERLSEHETSEQKQPELSHPEQSQPEQNLTVRNAPVQNPKSQNLAVQNLADSNQAGQNLTSSNLAAELVQLRAQMDAVHTLILQSARNQLFNSHSVPDLADLHTRLLDAQVNPILSKDIVDRLEAAMATDNFCQNAGASAGNGTELASNPWKGLRPDPARLEQFLRLELERRVALLPYFGSDHGHFGPVVVMVGPTGGGKTTSLAKLAVATSRHTPVRLFSLDRSRPGASQQLQALAHGSEIRFSPIETMDRLPEMIADARRKECVLIDTPGFGAAEQRSAEAYASVLAECPEIDVHVVVPAYMNAMDFRRALQRYRIFNPGKLLVTKLDEARTFGTAFSEAARAGLALSFLANGTRIPEDIRPATTEDLLAMVIDRPRDRARNAA